MKYVTIESKDIGRRTVYAGGAITLYNEAHP